MNPDLTPRLLEIAAELERGQAAQPLAAFVTETAADFASPQRAILILISAPPAFPVAPDPSAVLRRVNSPGAPWDWLQVLEPIAALADLGHWNQLAAFSPLVVVCIEAPNAAALAAARPLFDAFAAAHKRTVTLARCDLAPGDVPPSLLPILRITGFDPSGDWVAARPKPPPPDWSGQLAAWVGAFAAERASLPLLTRLEQLRQRAVLHRAVNEQRQAALMSQRDTATLRGTVEKARDHCQQAIDTVEKELIEGSRLFLVANGSGTTQLKSIVDQFGPDIIREERRPKSIVLTIDDGELRRLVQQVETLFWTNARRAGDHADQATAATLGDFGRELLSVLPDGTPPAAVPFDIERVRKGIAPMLHANIAYRGELPVKGFFERIQASRQIIFLIVGLLSLAGASALIRSPVVVMVTLAIFSVMLFKTARDFREEAAETRARELERLLELMRAQLRQQLQELEAVRINLWREHLLALRRAVVTSLDQALRDSATRQARELDEERQKIQLKQRSLDKAQRDLGGLEQRLQALLTPLRSARLKAEQTILQVLRA